jgi:hypothetical protein
MPMLDYAFGSWARNAEVMAFGGGGESSRLLPPRWNLESSLAKSADTFAHKLAQSFTKFVEQKRRSIMSFFYLFQLLLRGPLRRPILSSCARDMPFKSTRLSTFRTNLTH